MAENPIVPFENLVKGQRYLITWYEDPGHQTIKTERGRLIQDIPAIFRGIFPMSG